MTSQVPSNDNASLFGVMRSRLILVFLVCTVALTGYTLALQHSSDPIIWWQPDQQVITDGGSSVDRAKPEKSSKIDDPDGSLPEISKCSPKAAVVIGTVVTIAITALLVPPPIAFGVGSATATGVCWLVDKVS